MKSVATPPYAGAGAPAPGPRAYALGGITVFYFLARSEKPSPRCVESRATENYGRKQRWFLARSENLRLAGSSPVGTFSPGHEISSHSAIRRRWGACSRSSGLRPRRDNGFLLPRALGKTVTPLYRVQSEPSSKITDQFMKLYPQKSSPRPHTPHAHSARSGGAVHRHPLTPTPEQIHGGNQTQKATPAAQHSLQKVENT